LRVAADERIFIHRERLPTGLADIVIRAMGRAGFRRADGTTWQPAPYRAAAASDVAMRFEADGRQRPRAIGTALVLREGDTSVLVELTFGRWQLLGKDTAVLAGAVLCCAAASPLVSALLRWPALACAILAPIFLLRGIVRVWMTPQQARGAVLDSLARGIDEGIEADRASRTGLLTVHAAADRSEEVSDGPEAVGPRAGLKRG
jgi:hypothetical protein